MILPDIHINPLIKNKIQVKFYSLLICLFIVSCNEFIDKPVDIYNEMATDEALNDCINGVYLLFADALSMYNLLSVKSDDISFQTQLRANFTTIHPSNSLAPSFEDFEFFVDFELQDENAGGWALWLNREDFEGMWLYTDIACKPNYTDISNEFYRAMYRSILMANKIIFSINTEDKKEKWGRYLGEAYFLRAYMYYKLARVYGRVPLVEDVEVSYTLPLAQFNDIYASIENDLLTAVLYLPENKNSSRKIAQTPHKGTVKALLAEVYLTMGGYPLNDHSYYNKAAETAREVIENADFYGFGLMDDFANLWQWQHHNNKESVWDIYYRGETYNPKNKMSINPIKKEISSPIDKISVNQNFFRIMPNNYRKEMSFWHYACLQVNQTDNLLLENDGRAFFIFEDATYLNEASGFFKSDNFHGNVIGKKQTANFSCYSDSLIKTKYPPYKIIIERSKFTIANKLDYSMGLDTTSTSIYNYLYNNINDPEFDAGYAQFFHILRYAHTLLTYAEASARSGNPDDLAYEAVNIIRRRANKLPLNSPSIYDLRSGLSASAFADSVVAERGWEFCHEFEGRWNDIIRLQLYPKIEASRDKSNISPLVDDAYKGRTYFLPLPETDFWLNPNLESTSNE